MPTPVTTGVSTVGPSDDTTGGPPFLPDWGLQVGTTGGCPHWTLDGCADLVRSNALVLGDTPLGGFQTLYAVFASEAYCEQCVETPNVTRIVLVGSPAELPESGVGDPDDGLVIDLSVYEGPDNTTIDVLVTAYRDGAEQWESGTAHILGLPDADDLAHPFDPSDPHVVSGSITVEAPDWSLTGNFDAAYCPALNTFAICE
jgi:hypothetical protein